MRQDPLDLNNVQAQTLEVASVHNVRYFSAAVASAAAADCTVFCNSVLTLPAPSVDGLLGGGGDVEVGLAGPACQRDSLPLDGVVCVEGSRCYVNDSVVG